MERHSLRALLSVGLLVILAWMGIALIAKLHGQGAPVVLVVLWAIAAVVVVGYTVWSLVLARRARLERRSEATRGHGGREL